MRRKAAAYGALLKPREIARRTSILAGTFRDHQFDRTSPLAPLPAPLARSIYDHEITMPPFRYLDRPGTQTVGGLFFLLSLAKALDARSVFEIGTFIGLTTWALARNLQSATVHTLDLPIEKTPAMELEPSDAENRSAPIGRHVYETEPHGGTVIQHWGDSAAFDPDPWAGQVDLVYVDGAHSEPYVRADTKSAFAMLSENGAIVWDDYWRQVAGVRKVLDSLPGVTLYRVPGTRLVVHLAPGAEARLVPSPGA